MTKRIRLGLAIGWSLLILILCAIPGRQLPTTGFDAEDKMAHAGLFFIFGWLWANAVRRTAVSRIVGVGLLGVAFGVGTELLQGYLGWGRMPEVGDAIANMIGVAIALAIFEFGNRGQQAGDYSS